MSFTKRHLEEIEERGWGDTDTVVCSACVSDPVLVAAVVDHVGADPCSFCDTTPPRPGSPLEVVLELVVNGIRAEYDDPANEAFCDSGEGGYQTETWDTWDLLSELEVSDNSSVLDEIARTMEGTLWCRRNPGAAAPAEALTWSWEQFRNYVKTARRYTFVSPNPSTADGAGMYAMDEVPGAIARAVVDAGLVTTLSAGNRWWRARVASDATTYSNARDIGTPPAEFARDNRMTPAAIGAFYGASTSEGTIAEVAGYATPADTVSIGQFELVKDLRIVDLRTPPPVPSLFDPELRHLRPAIRFLHDFVESIREPAAPSEPLGQTLDYVPTQIITEFLRYELPHAVEPSDGIMWRSAAAPTVDACALFVTNDQCADMGHETDDTLLVLDPTTLTYRTVANSRLMRDRSPWAKLTRVVRQLRSSAG